MYAFIRSSAIFAVIVLFGISPALAVPTNGNFSAVDTDGNPTLDGWTPIGLVSNPAGYAFFEGNSSLTSQLFTIPDGAQNLSFDVWLHSFKEGTGGGPNTDVFTASLLKNDGTTVLFSYSINNELGPDAPADTDEVNYYDHVIWDMSGLIGHEVKLSFILVCDNDDGWPTDVTLDNVNVVPAPGAFILGLIGIGSAGLLRKLKAVTRI
jgi:hypothetical protein